MLAVTIVLSAVVLLLAMLVAGLLRSHADILKALHDLGAGVGEPGGDPMPTTVRAGAGAVPVTMGPPLPPERDSTSAPPVVGLTPVGDALALDVAASGGLTLLAFLSSGCASCAGLWRDLGRSGHLDLPPGIRVVAVTRGAEAESPAEVAERTAPGLVVVMTTDAWREYEVPGSPFFVLVDGSSGRRIGEGVANHLSQVADLVRRAAREVGAPGPDGTGATGHRTGAAGVDGPGRERENDRELREAGILPGDASLYPSSLDDLYGPTGPGRTPTQERT